MPVVDSIRGLADALGVNESSVRKAERSGRIALERDEQGNIDVENVKQQWNSNRRTSGGSESSTGVSYQKSRANKELFEALRQLRLRIAQQKGEPPFVIMSDKVLHQLATYKPTTLMAFGNINGIGEFKCATYGPLFLPVIIQHNSESGV